jgi:hypothetical protein
MSETAETPDRFTPSTVLPQGLERVLLDDFPAPGASPTSWWRPCCGPPRTTCCA